MDKNTKSILLIISAIALICVCATAGLLTTGILSFGRFVNQTEQIVNQAPQNAVRIGSEIADFEVPSGFGSPYGIHFGDVTLVGYKSLNDRSHLFLAQFPEDTNSNVDQMLKLIQAGAGDSNSIWFSTETVLIEQKTVNIRGQEVLLSISDGNSSDGDTYRAATATFQGRGGPSLVMISSPIDEWDIEIVEAFIASIQ